MVKEVKQNYNITEVACVKLSSNHIPYLGYVIITGPKGGRYLLDEFNIEMLLRERLGMSILLKGSIPSFLISYARRNGICREYNSMNTTDDGLKQIANKLNAVGLIRKQQRSTYKSLLNKVNLDKIKQEV